MAQVRVVEYYKETRVWSMKWTGLRRAQQQLLEETLGKSRRETWPWSWDLEFKKK